MVYLVILAFIGLCWVAPLPVQIVLLIIDSAVPDPIPAIDEMFLIIAIMNRVRKVVAVQNFIRNHKIISTLLVIAIIALMILFLYTIVTMLLK